MFKTISRYVFILGVFGWMGATLASDTSYFGSIDVIDFVYPSGGGAYNGSLNAGADNGWLVFAATAGNTLQIDITSSNFKNAVLLQDTADGNFAVGDVLDVLNFNITHVGDGTDLTILAHIGSLEFFSSGSLNFVAPYTGQYAIAIGNANDDISFCCDYSVTLSGNVGVVGPGQIPVPVPTMSVYGLGLTILILLWFAGIRLKKSQVNAR